MAVFDPESELGRVSSGQRKLHDHLHERQLHLDRLFEHMVDISNDPSGSEPELYLSAGDAATCWQFVKWADQKGWPNSDELIMQQCWIPNVPAWANTRRTVKNGLTKLLFFSGVGDVCQGYNFGKLGIFPSQQVALCDDGLLRSVRGRELKKSMAVGWGRLPDPELLLPALAVGMVHGVEYSAKSISEALLARVPSEHLPTHSNR